jgi:hypothetical protein
MRVAASLKLANELIEKNRWAAQNSRRQQQRIWDERQEAKRKKKEGDEPDPRHWWKTAVAASFPT